MKRRRIKAAVSVLLILCLTMALCACKAPAQGAACTLTFASWYTEEDSLAYRDIADKYRQIYPNVTVEFITLEKPENDFMVYGENAMAAIDQGRADLVLLHPSLMTAIYKNGWVGTYLADVSETPLFQQYSVAMQQMVTGEDGSAYGYPSFMGFAGLLVNTDLLQKCGVSDIPKTYTQWVNSMEQVKKAGYIPFASYTGGDYSSMFLIGAMGRGEVLYGSLPRDAGAGEVFSPAITKLAGLMDAGLLEKSLEEMAGGVERDVVTKAFPKGDVAYTICPSWFVPQLKQAAPDFSFQLAPIPACDKGPIVDIRAGWPVGVSASSPHQDEIARFLSFALLPENMELLADSKGNVSPLKNSTTGDPFYKDVLRAVQEGAVYTDSSNQYRFDMVDGFNRVSAKLLAGASLAETLRSFEEMLSGINKGLKEAP